VKGLAAALTLAALAASPAAAQSEEPPGLGREELVKVIDAYVLGNLQENLGLSDDQFVRILPLVKRWQTNRRAHQQRRSSALGEMRRLLERGAATEPRLKELLGELKRADLEDETTQRQDVEAIDAQLSVEQQAKLRVFEARIQERLREILQRRREQGSPRGRERP
jgi:hypothetical protein